MKQTFWITTLASVLIFMVASCGSVANVTPIPTISLNASDTSGISLVKASAVVVPAQETRLSFVMSGLVKEVTIEKGDQVQAGQTLMTLDTTELEFDKVAAEAALTSAEMDAQIQREFRKRINFNTGNFMLVSPPEEKIAIADANVEQMQSALEVVNASIAQGTLIAPIDGTVVEVNVSPGEYVQPAQVVVEIADLQNVRIETTDLSELDIAAVKIGQPANVYVEALNQEFPGKVTAISPIFETIGGDVVFKVTIQLDEQSRDLLWGMSTEVEINVE